MNPVFEPYTDALLCPACGANNLHHDMVTVFMEGEEVKAAPQSIQITDGDVRVSEDCTGNPSSRRHGLTIRFWCENCNNTSLLTLAQHKGCTYLEMIDAGRNPLDERERHHAGKF